MASAAHSAIQASYSLRVTWSRIVPSLPWVTLLLQATRAAAPQGIQPQRDDDDQADGNVLPVRAHVVHVHGVADEREEERAREGAQQRVAPAAEARAAHDRGGDD